MANKQGTSARSRYTRIAGLRPVLLAVAGLAGIANLAASTTSCGPEIRRYPLADPLWRDPDRGHVPKRPSKYYSGLLADGADQLFFRPLAKLFWFKLPGEARNVNSVDEVPNSSWFTNRIGLHPFTPADAARGACKDPPLDASKGPWIVSSAKPDGANPGFFIKAPNGRRYLLKFDGSSKPERATTADVIGSKIYHAAGFNAPCNSIVYFRKDILRIGKRAYAENGVGKRTKLTKKDVYKVLYKFRFFGGRTLKKELGWLQFRPDLSHPHRSCVLFPIGAQRPSDLAPRGARANHPLRYGVLKVFIHQRASIRPTSSLWLHFYDLGPKRGFRLVGMHRQPKPELPAGY